jgi:hypothetical protein
MSGVYSQLLGINPDLLNIDADKLARQPCACQLNRRVAGRDVVGNAEIHLISIHGTG